MIGDAANEEGSPSLDQESDHTKIQWQSQKHKHHAYNKMFWDCICVTQYIYIYTHTHTKDALTQFYIHVSVLKNKN